MKRIVLAFAVVVLCVMAAFVWPTRWRHDQMRRGQTTVLLRTDRFTGEAQYFDPRSGWTKAESRGILSQRTLDLLEGK